MNMSGELYEEDSLRRLQNILAALITALVLAACASPEEPKGEIRVMVTPSDAIVTVRDSNGNALIKKPGGTRMARPHCRYVRSNCDGGRVRI